MKSAYELAMERLEQKSPSIKLNEEQKSQIAEIDSLSRAKIAEKEVFLGGEISKAQSKGDLGEVAAVEKQLASERRRIEQDAEEKKAKVRGE